MTRTESITILLSSILAVEGWLLTHMADRISESPLLEYRVNDEVTPGGHRLTLQFQNLNRTIAYKNLKVIITAPRYGRITHTEVIPVIPASEGDEAPTEAEFSSYFIIPSLMPSSIVRAKVDYTGPQPLFRISSVDQPILAVAPSAETFIARNEVLILLLLIPVTLALGMGVVLILDRFHRRGEPVDA